MIHIGNLRFTYSNGGFRLAIPELSIKDGERVAVIGPSGSGKTTFLNLISGIAVPSCGSVQVGSMKLSAMSDAARRDFRIANIGFVFQDFELLEYLRVCDNILHPYRINRTLRLDPDVRARASGLAENMGLTDLLGRYPNQLSQGEKQRVAICRALLPRPGMLLTDEPTGNLDPASKGRIINLLSEHAGRCNATWVNVTHDHGCLDVFDRVIDFAQFESRVVA